MKHKNRLILFTRNPELGKVKTRLAKSIGDKAALKIYHFLLGHTKDVTESLSVDKAVYYSETIGTDDQWTSAAYSKHLQKGSDLGLRMAAAFEQAFIEGYQKVVIIGSDVFALEKHHIETAFKQLDDNDVVIGPAADGGYYLLGINKHHPALFRNKSWGTDTVLQDTLADLSKDTVHLLEELNDIDLYEDMKDIPELTSLL